MQNNPLGIWTAALTVILVILNNATAMLVSTSERDSLRYDFGRILLGLHYLIASAIGTIEVLGWLGKL